MRLLFSVLLMVSSTAFADYTGRLVIYCKSMPAGEKVYSAQGVEVSGHEIALKEYNPSSGQFETKSVIPTADCVISAESLVHAD
jgi:hypothetical protein